MLHTAFLLPLLAAPLLADEGDDGSAGSFGDELSGSLSAGQLPADASHRRTIESPIINGQDASETDWPMTGAMLMDADLMSSYGNYSFRMLVCSSTLIAPDVVLLAAHCVDETSFTYGYGTLENEDIRWTRQADLSDHDGSRVNDWPEDTIKAWDWVFHPQWDLYNLSMGLNQNYDIALLFLEEPVLDVQHAYLVSSEEATQIEVDDEVFVVGWGQQVATSGYQSPPPGTYAYKQMGTSYIAKLADWEFQVGALESDVRKCHGDSGGPSFMEVEAETVDTMRLVGVTSHAYDQTDCNQTGGVDTRVDHYLDWIDGELRSRCEDGTRAWCEEPGIVWAPLPEPVDTGDTAEPAEDGGEGEEDEVGPCGCAAGGAGLGWSLVGLLGALGLRRRRQPGAG